MNYCTFIAHINVGKQKHILKNFCFLRQMNSEKQIDMKILEEQSLFDINIQL